MSLRRALVSVVLRGRSWASAMSRAESLRLAAQLSSLATLEDVAQGVQALVEAPPELVEAAPSRPRGSILLNQRGPTSLSVKSCPVTPPDRSASSCRHSCSSASVNGPVESRSTAGAA